MKKYNDAPFFLAVSYGNPFTSFFLYWAAFYSVSLNELSTYSVAQYFPKMRFFFCLHALKLQLVQYLILWFSISVIMHILFGCFKAWTFQPNIFCSSLSICNFWICRWSHFFQWLRMPSSFHLTRRSVYPFPSIFLYFFVYGPHNMKNLWIICISE